MTVRNGVVLAGGRSRRMGSDKAGLSMCGEEELERVVAALRGFCDEVMVSVRPEQLGESRYAGLPLLPDPPGIEGPIAGITAAFAAEPDAAWLSIAVDMPYVGAEELQLLTSESDYDEEVRCFYNTEIGGPEPLLALFTPRFLPRLRAFLDGGGRGLFRLLKETPCTLVTPPRGSSLHSMNTPEEYDNAKEAVCHDD